MLTSSIPTEIGEVHEQEACRNGPGDRFGRRCRRWSDPRAVRQRRCSIRAIAAAAAVGDSTADTTATSTRRPPPTRPARIPQTPVRPDPTTQVAGGPEAARRRRHDHPGSGRQGDRCDRRRPSGRWPTWRSSVATGGFGGPFIGAGLDVVATTLGITTDEVRTALESGQTIADLAVSKGKTAQDVIDAIVAAATTKINAAGHRRQPHPGAGRQDDRQPHARLPPTSSTTSSFPAGGPGFGPGSRSATVSVARAIGD